MIKVKTRKNEYDHIVADCPFCPAWVYIRPKTMISPDPLRDLKRHIVHAAKNEAFDWALSEGSNGANFHLEYVREHYAMRPIRSGTKKMQFDNDLKL